MHLSNGLSARGGARYQDRNEMCVDTSRQQTPICVAIALRIGVCSLEMSLCLPTWRRPCRTGRRCRPPAPLLCRTRYLRYQRLALVCPSLLPCGVTPGRAGPGCDAFPAVVTMRRKDVLTAWAGRAHWTSGTPGNNAVSVQ